MDYKKFVVWFLFTFPCVLAVYHIVVGNCGDVPLLLHWIAGAGSWFLACIVLLFFKDKKKEG